MKFLIITFCFLLILGCKKDPFDYRTKFTGDFDFYIEASSYQGIPPNYTYKDTSYTSHGKVELTKEENTISISFTGGGSSTLTVYEDGTIEGGGAHGLCRGEFESTTKIKYYCVYSSPGASASYIITGEKND